MFKVLEPSIQQLLKPKLFSHNEHFLHYGFSWKKKFLGMSKAFDKVWQKGLIFESKSIGVLVSLWSLIESFLSNKLQRVLLKPNKQEEKQNKKNKKKQKKTNGSNK